MVKNILTIALLILICVGGYYWWQHRQAEKQMGGGEVQCVGCMSPEEKARFDKENAGETTDGQSEHKSMSARQEAASIAQGGGTPIAGTTATGSSSEPVNGQTPPIDQGGAVTNQVTTQPTTQAARTQTAYPATGATTTYAQPAPTAMPVGMPMSDSSSPNTPNGMRYGSSTSSAAYSWYRQGNLTWRVNSVTGQTCIDFATMEEWRKQIVLSHGCGRNA